MEWVTNQQTSSEIESTKETIGKQDPKNKIKDMTKNKLKTATSEVQSEKDHTKHKPDEMKEGSKELITVDQEDNK